ncbi:MAG TPA: hypothetical protein VF174_11690 [Micromonosporaceae bacterium]
MADARERYFRRLRRLRRKARRWSVLAGGFGGAAVVLTPYAGIGLPDAFWAAAAGGSLVLAAWRWADLRAHVAQPVPPPPDPAQAAEQARARLVATVERLPGGRDLLQEVRRQRERMAVRGSAAADAWARLDQAAATLAPLVNRLTGPGVPAVVEARDAERSLRDLAQRVAGVEKTLRFAPPDARPRLEDAHRVLVDQLTAGVTAYERLVAAAVAYLAEESRMTVDDSAAVRLTEASDLLRGVADGLAELRVATEQPSRHPV